MQLFTNMAISRKILVAFALALAIVCISGLFTATSLGTLTRSSAANVNSIHVKELNAKMLDAVIQQENALRGYAMLGRDELLQEYRENVGVFDESAKEFRATAKDPKQLERLDALVAEVKDLNERRFAELISFAADPATREKAQEISGKKQLSKVRDLVSQIDTRQDELIEARHEDQRAANFAASLAVWGGMGLTAAIAILMGWLLTRTIARPLTDMTGAMNRLAEGDNHIDVPAVGRGDEVGAMATALLVFKENAVAKAAADAAAARTAEGQRLVTTTLETHLAALSAGDLTAEINSEFPSEFAAVKSNFNDTLRSLRDLIKSVMESTDTIRTGSNEIAGASEDLARRTEANAASLEETAAAVSQMDDRLKTSAAAAGRTVSRADGAIATVTDGREVADEAVRAMTRVSDSAKGIDGVIEGLDKIAFQTRVLAMNAAVEAGRAGEAGRGFAVVADLVSALAMRAEEEAGRARDQLTSTQTDIVTAVEMVQKVDGALANISGDVGEVHKLLAEMAQDNQAQSSAISEISVAIGGMDQATQQNAAMVEETSAASRNLLTEITTLATQAARFTVDVRGAGIRSARPASPGASHGSEAARYTSPVKALPQAAVAALTAPDQSWAEF